MNKEHVQTLIDAINSRARHDSKSPEFRYYMRFDLWNALWSKDEELRHTSARDVGWKVMDALKKGDAATVEYIGRQLPTKDEVPPQVQDQEMRVFEYAWGMLIREERLPKRAEVVSALGIDRGKVSSYYKKLAEWSGLDLDERRPKTNVWA